MTEENKPIGQLYIRAYQKPTETLRDSPKMRLRVARLVERLIPNGLRDVSIARQMEEEFGIDLVSPSNYVEPYVNWERLFRNKLDIEYLLSILTFFGLILAHHRPVSEAKKFRDELTRIFAQEGVGYSIDEKFGFHPAFDQEFERSRSSTVRVLTTANLSHESEFVEVSEKALLCEPLDGRAAIRATFDAAENLFKRLTGKQNISTSSIRSDLKPLALSGIPNDGKSNIAVEKMLGAFEQWAVACHFYRHAPGEIEAAQPASDTAILIVSQGYGYIRWLAEMYLYKKDSGVSDPNTAETD